MINLEILRQRKASSQDIAKSKYEIHLTSVSDGPVSTGKNHRHDRLARRGECYKVGRELDRLSLSADQDTELWQMLVTRL